MRLPCSWGIGHRNRYAQVCFDSAPGRWLRPAKPTYLAQPRIKGGTTLKLIQGKDIVAAILLAGAFTLKALGHDGFLDTLIVGIALAYGVVAIPSWHRNHKD